MAKPEYIQKTKLGLRPNHTKTEFIRSTKEYFIK